MRSFTTPAALAARIVRINPAGSVAKIGLTASDGRELQVDLTLERGKPPECEIIDLIDGERRAYGGGVLADPASASS